MTVKYNYYICMNCNRIFRVVKGGVRPSCPFCGSMGVAPAKYTEWKNKRIKPPQANTKETHLSDFKPNAPSTTERREEAKQKRGGVKKHGKKK